MPCHTSFAVFARISVRVADASMTSFEVPYNVRASTSSSTCEVTCKCSCLNGDAQTALSSLCENLKTTLVLWLIRFLDDDDVSFRIRGQELAQSLYGPYGTVALSDHHCLVCLIQ